MGEAAGFGGLSEVYDSLVDWPKRLANEERFYRDLFERHAVRRVLDAACGTGRHAAMFHSWGLEVEGADLSCEMLEAARTRFGEPSGLRWVNRSFEDPPADRFDAEICAGNSLALCRSSDVLRRAVGAMLKGVRPGGVAVFHVLNLWSLPEGRCVWQRCRKAALADKAALILKGVHRAADRGYVDLAVIDPVAGRLDYSESVCFMGVDSSDLEQPAQAAGAAAISFHGDYHGAPYVRQTSPDLLAVAVAPL